MINISMWKLTSGTLYIAICNLNYLKKSASIRSIKSWVAPTLHELRRRSEKLALQTTTPIVNKRSDFIEWNYRSELFAFGKRLQEEFNASLLQTAFVQESYANQQQTKQQELGIEESKTEVMVHNGELSKHGESITRDYVEAFLKYSLPKVPIEGQQAISSYLLSTNILSNIASNLGMKDLLLDIEYPPSLQSLAQSLLAVIGALEKSSGLLRSHLFVRDFICTQLNQHDLLDIWSINDPEELLHQQCKEKMIEKPEPRIIASCGKNTVLAAFMIGLYTNKQLIGKGYGEDIPTAIRTASLDALLTMFGIQENMTPFNYNIQIDNK